MSLGRVGINAVRQIMSVLGVLSDSIDDVVLSNVVSSVVDFFALLPSVVTGNSAGATTTFWTVPDGQRWRVRWLAGVLIQGGGSANYAYVTVGSTNFLHCGLLQQMSGGGVDMVLESGTKVGISVVGTVTCVVSLAYVGSIS